MNTEKQIIKSLRTLGGHLRKGLSNQKSSVEADKQIRRAIAEELRSKEFYQKFAKIFVLGRDAKGAYAVIFHKPYGSAKGRNPIMTELETALAYAKQMKNPEFPDKLISYCAQQLIESEPRLASSKIKKNTRIQIEVSVRKSLRRFSHLLTTN